MFKEGEDTEVEGKWGSRSKGYEEWGLRSKVGKVEYREGERDCMRGGGGILADGEEREVRYSVLKNNWKEFGRGKRNSIILLNNSLKISNIK